MKQKSFNLVEKILKQTFLSNSKRMMHSSSTDQMKETGRETQKKIK